MSLMELLIVVAIVAILAVCGWAFVDAATAPTFELRKSQWKCAASQRETSTTYILVGKVMVPQYHTHDVCTNWVRR